MLKHVVLYKLLNRNDADEMVRRFRTMRGKIPQLRSLEAGVDIVASARAYDVCLVCEFASREDLEIYAEHPVHKPVKEYVRSVIEEAHSVDFEY